MSIATYTSPRFYHLLQLWFSLLLLCLAIPQAEAASNCPAESFVMSAGRAYDQAARARSPSAFASAASRFIDMDAAALYALGRYRNLLPKSRQAEYFRLTRNFMGGFMLKYGKDFRAANMRIVSCTGGSSNMTINAILGNGDKVAFRVYRSGGGYQIRDMRISGIWLIQQLRSTFVGTISRANGDIDELFKFIRD
jgi:ABC-type transporter MlaC component